MGVEEYLDQVLKANVLTWIVAVNPSIKVFSMAPLIKTQALEYADLILAKILSKLPSQSGPYGIEQNFFKIHIEFVYTFETS